MKRIRQFSMVLSLLVLSVTPFALGTRVVAREEGWTTHQLPFYSLAYPANWSIEASDKGDYVALYPPEYDALRDNRIEIAYLGYEIPADQSLESWYDMYYRAAHGDLPPSITVLDHRLFARADDKGVWQRLHVAVVNELGPSQAVMLAYGHLVLSIGTYTHDADLTEILAKIADSVRFAPEAPRTFRELHATSQPHPSLEAILAENRRGGVISQDIVTRDAKASENLPILPPATPSPEFLELERAYQEWLEQHGLP